jgi:L-threonylcarbamoyladenylate synthase
MIRLPVDPRHPDPEALARAVKAIAGGGVVALPTDTLYGLAVDPRQPVAVEALYGIKGRADQPLP